MAYSERGISISEMLADRLLSVRKVVRSSSDAYAGIHIVFRFTATTAEVLRRKTV